MKTILTAIITLISISVFAQFNADHGGPGRGTIPGYGEPGYGPGYPGPGRPNRPPPSYDSDYGPGYTVRWQNFGTTKMPKFIEQDITLNVRGRYVNEIYLRATDNPVQITSVLVYLRNGQVFELRQLTGYLGKDQEIRDRLDWNYSIRAERIVIKATSPGLVGTRGNLNIQLGLAQ